MIAARTYKTIYALAFALALQISPMQSGQALAHMELNFDYTGKTLAHKLATEEILKDERYKEDNELYGPFSVAAASFDLDNNGVPEIIATLNDINVTCDIDMSCPHFIFSYSNRGLVKIGEFNTYGIAVNETKTKNIHDIKVWPTENPREYFYYVWDGQKYVKKERLK